MSILQYLSEKLEYTKCVKEDVQFPEGFDVEELKKISSYAGKQKYVAQHLEKLGAGSARVVYKIDDTHVLKLAKNAKGIAQNEVEGDWSMHKHYPEFVPELIEVDDDYLWIIKERINKITKGEFAKLSGYKYEDFSTMLRKFVNDRTSNKKFPWSVNPDEYAEFMDDEFIQELSDFIINYDLEVGDIGGSISNWGKSTKHTDNPVLADVGLSKSVHQQHYKR
jgi:hypothetical protein